MSDQNTTVRVGFKADTAGLEAAERQIGRVERGLEKLRRTFSVPGGSGGSGGSGGFGGGFLGGIMPPGMSGFMASPGGYVGRTAMRSGVGALGALGVATGITAAVVKAIGEGRQWLQVIDPLSKQLGIVGARQEKFNQKLIDTGTAIGRNKTEMAQLVQSYTALAGVQQDLLDRQVNVSALFAKGAGIDQELMTSTMGSMAQMGAFGKYGGGGGSPERFAAILADAIAHGGMAGRESELFGSIQALMGQQLNVLTRLSPGSDSAMIGALTAMNASNQPGLMGQRGANVLSRMNNAFMNPSGDFGEYMMYNALGGGDYFDFKMRLEEGIFGQGNWGQVDKYLKDNIKDPKYRWHAKSQLFGITRHQARALEGLNLQGDSGFLNMLEGVTGGDLEGVSPDKLALMGRIYNSSGKEREALLKDARLGNAAKGWDASTDIRTIMEGIAQGPDFLATTNEELLSNLSKIDNKLIAAGEEMIKGVNRLIESIEALIRAMGVGGDSEDGSVRGKKTEEGYEAARENLDDAGLRGNGQTSRAARAAREGRAPAPKPETPVKSATPPVKPAASVKKPAPPAPKLLPKASTPVDDKTAQVIPIIPGTGKKGLGSFSASANAAGLTPEGSAAEFYLWDGMENGKQVVTGPTPEEETEARMKRIEAMFEAKKAREAEKKRAITINAASPPAQRFKESSPDVSPQATQADGSKEEQLKVSRKMETYLREIAANSEAFKRKPGYGAADNAWSVGDGTGVKVFS